jgi:ribosome-binding factor A
MDPRRWQRLSEAMREELDEIVGYEMADPRLGSVGVTDMHLSLDCRSARVMVRVGGDRQSQEESLAALRRAGGFIRRQLIERIDIYRIPELHFELDAEVDADRVSHLLRRMRKGRAREQERNP